MYSKEEKAKGVIAASAGNHALAVCYHGQQLGIPVVVVMPRHAPIMKVNNCRSFGAVVIIRGNDLAEVKLLRKIDELIEENNIASWFSPSV